MLSKTYKVPVNGALPVINIGREGEYNVREILFDMSEFAETYGPGSAEILLFRDGTVSILPTTATGNAYTWTITSTYTKEAGMVELLIRWYTADGLAKTSAVRVSLSPDRVAVPTDPPAEVKDWIDVAHDAVQEVKDAIPKVLDEAKKSGLFDGPKGDTYELTAEDIEQIAEIVKGKVLRNDQYEKLLSIVLDSNYAYNAYDPLVNLESNVDRPYKKVKIIAEISPTSSATIAVVMSDTNGCVIDEQVMSCSNVSSTYRYVHVTLERVAEDLVEVSLGYTHNPTVPYVNSNAYHGWIHREGLGDIARVSVITRNQLRLNSDSKIDIWGVYAR